MMNKGIIILCEVGVLLNKTHKEYNAYNHVWNHKWGFYNENDILYEEKDKDKAIEYAKQYVNTGVENTYAIVSNEGICEWEDELDDGDLDIIPGCYDCKDVIYSVAKINGKIVENFL